MIVLGIDPGASGALAFFDTIAGTLDIVDMPVVTVERNGKTKREISAPMLAGIVRPRKVDCAALERVFSRPGQGVSSVFAFGVASGIVTGVLAGLEIPVDLVTPQAWQKATGTRNGKDGARQRAADLFPAYAATFARKKDDGRADAALIAYWRFMK